MAINKMPDGLPPDEPVLSTLPGVAPRGLRSDPFSAREEVRRPSAPVASASLENTLVPPPKHTDDAARDWDFAMPSPVEARQVDPHIDPDVNWRRHVGLRPPVEPLNFSETSRERFNENWERLATGPATSHRSKSGNRMHQSAFTRWLFRDGQLDVGNACGALLLAGLLVAAIIYGTKVLSHGEVRNTSVPAAQTISN